MEMWYHRFVCATQTALSPVMSRVKTRLRLEKFTREGNRMDKFVINGGKRLSGEVEISGNKNASVAILAAVSLCDEPCRIENLSKIGDVDVFMQIYERLGAKITHIDEKTIEIDCSTIKNVEIPYKMTKLMRASYYFIGTLLGRFGRAKVCMPGGCDFGSRPIDQHIKGFEALGAAVSVEHGFIETIAKNGRLIGNSVYFDTITVGATINVMLAATKADGLTVIENAAKEPHVVDVANFLNSAGADIRGAGTDVIKIRGVPYLHSTVYGVIPDQIEAGTFMAIAAATGGDILIKNIIPKHLESISAKFTEMGAEIIAEDDWMRVRCSGRLQRVNIKTQPHPGFPTDMQPQAGVLCAVASGTSVISEGVTENRFRYTEELARMGAMVKVDGKTAVFEGVENLTGATVRATDLRAGVAMVIAGLVAKGTTEVEDIIYIERGYEFLEKKLSSLGADIKRVSLLKNGEETALNQGTDDKVLKKAN